MKAVTFRAKMGVYIRTYILGKIRKKFYYSKHSCVRLEDVIEPELPGDDWVKVKTIYGGICGSDLGLVKLHDSPLLSPFASEKFVIGHENIGIIVEKGKNVTEFEIGERIVADDKQSCEPRGLAKCTNCSKGNYNLCLNFTEGNMAPGTIMGSCADTGGSWGEFYVAHKSRLFKVPDNLKDEEAILVDPLSSAIHPVLKDIPTDDEKILIIGSGIIGLLLTAVLRVFGSKADITVLARHTFQAELAEKFGASRVIRSSNLDKLAELTNAKVVKPLLGDKYLIGGFDRIYDCVGSENSIKNAVKWATSGGKIMLVGLASKVKMDWTLIWFKELTLYGVYGYGTDIQYGETRRTHSIALELLSTGKIDPKPLVTHVFSLKDYKSAIDVASNKKKHKSIKVLLKP
ncbi:MAG: alcohol dehydrogenase catalytic domain-containing protein [Eubacteriales bacterium]|nr:alcohol dehydrogenase catalytic domain-containing protein [Eubacteriales bacterium]